MRIWEIDPCALLVGISNGAAATGNITTIMDVPEKTTSRTTVRGSPDGSAGKKICLQCRTPRFNSWVRKVPWKRDRLPTPVFLGFPVAQLVENLPAMQESACNARICLQCGRPRRPGLGRSPGEGKGYQLQYAGLENSMDCSPWGRRVGHN